MAKEIENININGEAYEISKIYAKMGISFERFVELLERDFYCPILTSDPTTATIYYTDTDGENHDFQQGQFALVEDESSTGGYKVWQCLSNSGTTAVWICMMDVVKGALNGKQETITDLETIRSGAALGATALQSYTEKYTGTYSKPSGGIPKSDLASTVQTSLGKADTALQSFTETDPVFSASAAAGIKSSDITNWNNKTSNTGTITGIKMNGSSKGTSGVVDLGNVITGDGTVLQIVKVSALPSSPVSTTLYIIPE